MQLSWTLASGPISTLAASPRMTVPNQTLESASRWTSPISCALGATKAATSAALPLGRPLLHEGSHAFPKILRHVAHQHQVLGFLEPQLVDDALHGHLGRSNGQRCVGRDLLGELQRARFEAFGLNDLGEHAD